MECINMGLKTFNLLSSKNQDSYDDVNKELEEEEIQAEQKRINEICAKLSDVTPQRLNELLENDDTGYFEKWHLNKNNKWYFNKSDKLEFFETVINYGFTSLSDFEKARSKELLSKEHLKKHNLWKKRNELIAEKIKNCGAMILTEFAEKKYKSMTFGNFKIEDENCANVYNSTFNSEAQFKILYGDYGRGKTHLAFSIAHRKLKQSFSYKDVVINEWEDKEKKYNISSFFYITGADLSDEYRKHINSFDKKYKDFVSEIIKNNSLIIIDEIGNTENSKTEQLALYPIIDSCDQNKRELILCSNLPKDKLINFLTRRIVDRISSNCDFIEFAGDSYRFTHRKQDIQRKQQF